MKDKAFLCLKIYQYNLLIQPVEEESHVIVSRDMENAFENT